MLWKYAHFCNFAQDIKELQAQSMNFWDNPRIIKNNVHVYIKNDCQRISYTHLLFRT